MLHCYRDLGAVGLILKGRRGLEFETYVGPILGHKIPNKKKCWEFMFGHFEALVLNSNTKGFLLGVDFGASWAFRPILGHWGKNCNWILS